MSGSKLPQELIDAIIREFIASSKDEAEIRNLGLVHPRWYSRVNQYHFKDKVWRLCTSSELKTRLYIIGACNALQIRSLILSGKPTLTLCISDICRVIHLLPTLRVLYLCRITLHGDPSEKRNFQIVTYDRAPMEKLCLDCVAIQRYVDTENQTVGSSLGDLFDLFSNIQLTNVYDIQFDTSSLLCDGSRRGLSSTSVATIQTFKTRLPNTLYACQVDTIWEAVALHRVVMVDVQVASWPFTSLMPGHLGTSLNRLKLSGG